MPRTPGIRRYIFNTLTVVSLLLLSGCIHWPSEPRWQQVSALPAPLIAKLHEQYPGASIVGPVDLVSMENRWGRYEPDHYSFEFRDQSGKYLKATMDVSNPYLLRVITKSTVPPKASTGN